MRGFRSLLISLMESSTFTKGYSKFLIFPVSMCKCCRIIHLYFLEQAIPPVIHRDLKSANILLDHTMRAKVSF